MRCSKISVFFLLIWLLMFPLFLSDLQDGNWGKLIIGYYMLFSPLVAFLFGFAGVIADKNKGLPALLACLSLAIFFIVFYVIPRMSI